MARWKFFEHKEVLSLEPPKDIDVVTFFNLPNGQNETTFLPIIADLFDVENTKKTYRVDAYPCVLGGALEEEHVTLISYWYSLWSHRRNGLWKGFVQVEISEDDDNFAAALLAQIEQELAGQ